MEIVIIPLYSINYISNNIKLGGISLSKVLIPNYDFVRNWSENQLDEFINVPSGIPNDLMDIVQEVIPNINILRKYAAFDHPEFEELDQEQSIIPRRLVRENLGDTGLGFFL